MKLRKTFAICLLAISMLFVTACGGIHLSEIPKTTDTVYGNGGLSVTKGEFVYFVNSYTSYNGLNKSDNNSGSVKNSAIYRTKLKEGKVEYNADGQIQNFELVVSKICGYEFTNLHIFDDYIYYATPNMEYNKDGSLSTSAVDFCRTKLDGSQTEIIYTAKDYDTNSKYEVYKIGGSVYLVVFEKDKLVKVEISTRIKSSITMISNVGSVIMPKVDTYAYSDNVAVTGTEGYIYYVRDFNEELDNAFDTSTITGNVLGRVCIADGKIDERKNTTTKFELKDLSQDYLFVTKGIDIYAIDKSFPLSENQFGVSDIRISYSDSSLNFTKFYATKNSDGYIYSKDSKTYYVNNVKNPKTYLIFQSEIEIKNDDVEFAYYLDGTSIKRISLLPKYYIDEAFELNGNATINGVNLNQNDEIPAFTIINQNEYFAISNILDKAKFKELTDAELIISDTNLDTTYIDFTNDGEIYFFIKYSNDNDENTRPYLNRVLISQDNKTVKTDKETDEVIEPTTYSEFNLGYNKELMCLLEDGFKEPEEK